MPEDFISKIYSKIGAYFTGTKRRNIFWIVALLLFISLCVVSYLYKLIVPTETLYSVYSSLIQGLLALVALLGASAMFKLELRRNRPHDLTVDTFTPESLHKFMVYTFALFFVSLILLMLTPFVSKYYLGWPALYGTLMLTSRAFFIVTKETWSHISS